MPSATGTVRVRGYRELDRTFGRLSRDVQKEVRNELADVGEPVRQTAEQLAVGNISNIGDRWSRMRLGVISRAVYIAPRARPTKRGSPRKNLALLLLNDTMIPAVNQHEAAIVAGVDGVLDRLGREEGF